MSPSVGARSGGFNLRMGLEETGGNSWQGRIAARPKYQGGTALPSASVRNLFSSRSQGLRLKPFVFICVHSWLHINNSTSNRLIHNFDICYHEKFQPSLACDHFVRSGCVCLR